MNTMTRKKFIATSALASGGIFTAPAFVKSMVSDSPNERINIGLAGISGNRVKVRGMINGRGIVHVNAYADIPNVRVKTICDVDERLFAGMSKTVEEKFGQKPETVIDFRKMLEDKDIDVISIATPDHWHALMTVWACQAGKDVYVEKPVCHSISEGRKMVEAARKYKRIVQSGICYRSSNAVKEGIKYIHEGKLGKIYMAKGITYRYREPIGIIPDSPVPEGVHWDLFLGPAPMRPFNENRYIYQWHWNWDTGTTEFGNNGIYRMDTVRWALNKYEHPVKIHCMGGKFGRNDDQEVPNTMVATYEYADGIIVQNEVRGLPTNPEGIGNSGDVFIFGDQGWMSLGADNYKTYFGPSNEPGPTKSDKEFPPGELHNGWENLIRCVRSGKVEELDNEIIEGHYSAAVGHLGVISYRTGRKLEFDSQSEKFPNDSEANSYLTRKYRKPYIMPEKV